MRIKFISKSVKNQKGDSTMPWDSQLVDALKDDNGQFIVGTKSRSTGAISIASHPAIHSSKTLAVNESERLARLHNDRIFVVLKVVSTVSIEPIQPQYTIRHDNRI